MRHAEKQHNDPKCKRVTVYETPVYNKTVSKCMPLNKLHLEFKHSAYKHINLQNANKYFWFKCSNGQNMLLENVCLVIMVWFCVSRQIWLFDYFQEIVNISEAFLCCNFHKVPKMLLICIYNCVHAYCDYLFILN